jgi:hypothetical protein
MSNLFPLTESSVIVEQVFVLNPIIGFRDPDLGNTNCCGLSPDVPEDRNDGLV